MEQAVQALPAQWKANKQCENLKMLVSFRSPNLGYGVNTATQKKLRGCTEPGNA